MSRCDRRRLEVDRRRVELHADLRRPAGRRDRRGGDLPSPAPRSSGSAPAKAIRATRCPSATASTSRSTRRHLAAPRPRQDRAHSSHRPSSVRSQHRVGRGHGSGLGTERRSRHLQDHRRRQDLDEGPVRQRPHRRRRSPHRSDNPNKLFAAMWEYRRWPWFFNSGGPAPASTSATTAARSWKQLTPEDGLPEGNLGRIGVAGLALDIRASSTRSSKPRKAHCCAPTTAGRKWTAVNTETNVASRPFLLRRHSRRSGGPESRLQRGVADLALDRRREELRTLVPFSKVHPDYHALWIDRTTPRTCTPAMTAACGEQGSRPELALSWPHSSRPVLPHRRRHAVPYNIYGGMQDNGSWKGPNTSWRPAGSALGLAGSRLRRRSPHSDRERSDGRLRDEPGKLHRALESSRLVSAKTFVPRQPLRRQANTSMPPELRFNWNAAIAADPFNPQRPLFRQPVRATNPPIAAKLDHYQPDLTTNRKDCRTRPEAAPHADSPGGELSRPSLPSGSPSIATRMGRHRMTAACT